MITRRPHHLPHRPGVVLLMAMLIMSAIIGATIAVSVLIAISVQQSRNINNFIVASVAADSGLERSLAIVKLGRVDQTLIDTAGDKSVGTVPPGAIDKTDASLPTVGSHFEVAADSSIGSNIVTGQILQGQTYNLDILKKGSSLPNLLNFWAVAMSGTCSRSIPSIELSIELIGPDGLKIFTSRRYFNPCMMGLGYTIDLRTGFVDDLGNPPSGPDYTDALGYRLHIRPVNFNMNFLSLYLIDSSILSCPGHTPSTGDYCPANYFGQVAITSTGRYGQSQSQKTATVLWQVPASPLFNNVIFTEGEIVPK